MSSFQDDKLVDLSGADLPDDDDDDVLLKIDSELASSLQPGGSADLLGRGARRGQTEDFFKEEGREESEVLLNQLLDTSNEVGNLSQQRSPCCSHAMCGFFSSMSHIFFKKSMSQIPADVFYFKMVTLSATWRFHC